MNVYNMNRPASAIALVACHAVIMVVFYFALTSKINSKISRSPSPSASIEDQLLQSLTFSDIFEDSERQSMFQRLYVAAPSTEPYSLREPENINPSMGQAQEIDKILKQKRNGFYVECGGLDGETRSNSLFFERERGWQGLLIEADPLNYAKLEAKHRKAYTSNTCLATSTEPSIVTFSQNANVGHISDLAAHDQAGSKGEVKVQSFPLHYYLAALKQRTVDYFSLDVEGAEFKVLQTIPWDEVDIKTLSVEFVHNKEGKETIKEYMLSKGYVVSTEVNHPRKLANDFIFVKQELL